MSPTPVGRTDADGPPNCRGAGESRGHDLARSLSLSLSGEKMIRFAQVAPGRQPFRGDISCQTGTLYLMTASIKVLKELFSLIQIQFSRQEALFNLGSPRKSNLSFTPRGSFKLSKTASPHVDAPSSPHKVTYELILQASSKP